MATLDELLIIGQPGELDWYQYLFLEELQRQRERDLAGAPAVAPAPAPAPPPTPLTPEPPLVPVKPPSPPANDPLFRATLRGLGRYIPWLLPFIPTSTGPREHDELDPGDVPFTQPQPDIPVLDEFPIIGSPFPIDLPNLEPFFDQPYARPIEQPIPTIDFGLRPGADIFSPPGVTPTPDRTSPAPDPWADPFLEPVSTPSPDIRFDPQPDPRSQPDRNPRAEPAPDAVPVPTPFSPPIPDLVPAPGQPDVVPDLVPDPTDFFDVPTPSFKPPPFLDPYLNPFDSPIPEPEPDKDKCNCKKEKKKKKKERQPRSVCYRGTYVQRAKGISYRKIEQVPCESVASSSTALIKKIKKKLKPGQFPGTGLIGGMDGSQITDLAAHAFKELAPIVLDYLKKKKTPAKKVSKKRNRKPKTRIGRQPGDLYSSPFPMDVGG